MYFFIFLRLELLIEAGSQLEKGLKEVTSVKQSSSLSLELILLKLRLKSEILFRYIPTAYKVCSPFYTQSEPKGSTVLQLKIFLFFFVKWSSFLV